MLLLPLVMILVGCGGLIEAHRRGKSLRRHLHRVYSNHKGLPHNLKNIHRTKCFKINNCLRKSKDKTEEGALQRSLQNVFDHYETLRHILTNHRRKKVQGLLPLLNPAPENIGNLSAFTASEYINGNPTVSMSHHQATPNHMLPNQNIVHRAHAQMKPTQPAHVVSYRDHGRPVTIKPALTNESNSFLNTSTCLSYASNDFDDIRCTNRSVDANDAATTAKPPAPPKMTTEKPQLPPKTTQQALPATTAVAKAPMPLKTTAMVKPAIKAKTTMVTPIDQPHQQAVQLTTQTPISAANASTNETNVPPTTVAPTDMQKQQQFSSKSPLDEREDWLSAANDLENITTAKPTKKEEPNTQAPVKQKDEFEPCAKDSATIRSLSSAINDTLNSNDLVALCAHFNREIPQIIDQIMDKERDTKQPAPSAQGTSFQSGILNYMTSKQVNKHKTKKNAAAKMKKRLIRKKAFVTKSEVPYPLLL